MSAKGVPLGLEIGLRNYWYPVLRSESVLGDRPHGFKALGEHLVAWRNSEGHPLVVVDKCPHRAAKLSAGRILAGDIQCAWHGLRFDGSGKCTLIPWDSESPTLQNEIRAKSYPTEELGGWIWSYLGDPSRFAPPPLEEVVPEELLHPEKFIVFHHPVQIWNCNWLQALDGSDGFHAVILHSESQPADTSKKWVSGKMAQPIIPLADRRMRIVKTPQGIRGVALDSFGKDLHHGHFMEGWNGERWTLPGLFTIPIAPAPGLPNFVARLYQFAIDATHTQSSRWVAMRAGTPEERLLCKRAWEDTIGSRQHKVMEEDRVICESLGDLAESREEEFLLSADQDLIKVRAMFADAFIQQSNGNRLNHARESLVFPF